MSPLFKIVEKSSAILDLPDDREQKIPLYLNHQDLCRFSGPQDANYAKVLELIRIEASRGLVGLKTEGSSFCTGKCKWYFVICSVSILTSRIAACDEAEKECAPLLNLIDVDGYQAKIVSRVGGTLEWVLQKPQYNKWTLASTTRLLWVTGYAGRGKTVLASFIYWYLIERQSQALICRFFCDDKIEKSRDPCVLLRSLIFQIVRRRRRLWRIVKKAADAGGLHILGQLDALWNIFEQLARAETKYPIIVIIDAFDEIEPESQDRVAAFILRLVSLRGTTSVKFLITRRPNVEYDMDSLADSALIDNLSLEESLDEINRDIKNVVRHRLDRMEKKGVCKPSVRDTLEAMLVAKADQTFLWVEIVLRLLEKRKFLLMADAQTMVNLLPKTLAALYRHLLESIPADDQATAARVLRLLVVCDRPLTGEEIGIISTIGSDHKSASSLTTDALDLGQDSVESLLGELVRLHDSRIELCHQSLKDYLISLSNEGQDPLAIQFGVDRARDKITLFHASSKYLSLEEFQQDINTILESLDEFETFDTEDIRNLGSTLETIDAEETSDAGNTSSCSSSSYGTALFDQRMFVPDLLSDEATWARINAKYKFFDYAALHWAADYATCAQTATAEDATTALSLCDPDTPHFKIWFNYFWYKQVHGESVPSSLDALMVVAYFGHTSNLRHLLDQSEAFDLESKSRALYWAARQGHCACVNELLQHPSCDPHSSKEKSEATLLVAAQFGHLDCVSLLLEDPHVNINTQDHYGRSPLSLAVGNNHVGIVTTLLERKAIDTNLQNKRLDTPLHMAIYGNASDSVFRQLLDNKCTDLNRIDGRGRSVLSWAAELGAVESVKSIIKSRRASIDSKDSIGRAPLSYAAQHGHLSIVKTLIEIGHADPLGKDGDGRNAHCWAAMLRSPTVLYYLVQKFPQGADSPDENGWTPLAWTLDPPGRPENMRVLIQSGHVDVNPKKGSNGRSILSWVAHYGHTEMVDMLIRLQNIELDPRDEYGNTPLSEAAAAGNLDIVQMLMATGKVDVNSRDEKGQTPLSWAARGGHEEVVQELLKFHDIVVDARDLSGETALDIARRMDRDKIVLTLEAWNRAG